MTLGYALKGLVAGVIKIKWVCIICFPLDDIPRCSGRSFSCPSCPPIRPTHRTWFCCVIVTSITRVPATVPLADDVPIPSVTCNLYRSRQVSLAIGSCGGGFVLGTHQHVGIVSQKHRKLAMFKCLNLTGKLFSQTRNTWVSNVCWHGS